MLLDRGSWSVGVDAGVAVEVEVGRGGVTLTCTG